MKKIYVCSALRGDVEENIRKARCYCEYVVKEFGNIPVAPHIYFTQFLDDNIAEDREFGISAGLFLLSECDELWYFGDTISRGMTDEIKTAMNQGIPVKYIPTHHYDEYMTERNDSFEIE
jgi:hypothetical protein